MDEQEDPSEAAEEEAAFLLAELAGEGSVAPLAELLRARLQVMREKGGADDADFELEAAQRVVELKQQVIALRSGLRTALVYLTASHAAHPVLEPELRETERLRRLVDE